MGKSTKNWMTMTALLALAACARMPAEEDEPVPLAAEEAAPEPAPPPVVAALPPPVVRQAPPPPVAAPVVARAPVTPPARLPPGAVLLKAAAPLRGRPVLAAEPLGTLPAGSAVQIGGRTRNGAGDWWFVISGRQQGWIPAPP